MGVSTNVNTRYSFGSISGSIFGVGLNITFGDQGVSEAGMTFTRGSERSEMTKGSDGSIQHTEILGSEGMIKVSFHKVSPIHQVLMQAFKQQKATSNGIGQNTITVRDTVRGDNHTFTGVAFVGEPSEVVYNQKGEALEWEFNYAYSDLNFGGGAPSLT